MPKGSTLFAAQLGAVHSMQVQQCSCEYCAAPNTPPPAQNSCLCCRTCSAALEAVLPDGCARTVYLCDDGGDITKRKWVQSKAAEKNVSIVYISGRKRTPGEMNGKSANLNNCLRQVR